jgi:hypothetical protein
LALRTLELPNLIYRIEMKKNLSWALAATILLTLPSLAMAKGKKDKLEFRGRVTAVTDTSLTVQHGKKDAGEAKTITVPAGTSIADDAGTAVKLSDLVGKHVMITESAADTAQSIVVKTHKDGKKKKNA